MQEFNHFNLVFSGTVGTFGCSFFFILPELCPAISYVKRYWKGQDLWLQQAENYEKH